MGLRSLFADRLFKIGDGAAAIRLLVDALASESITRRDYELLYDQLLGYQEAGAGHVAVDIYKLADAPVIDEFAAAFASDPAETARTQISAWADGAPIAGGLLGGSVTYGRTFVIGSAIRYCDQLITDIENARVALGDIPVESIPRYRRGGRNNWVYMQPDRDYLATPPQAEGE